MTLLYQRDTLALLAKYGLAGAESGQRAVARSALFLLAVACSGGHASYRTGRVGARVRCSPEAHRVIDLHRQLGAKLVGFGGWDMPLAYGGGTIAEHRACRQDAVVFDVSHLGTVRVEGADAFDRLQSALTNDLTPGLKICQLGLRFGGNDVGSIMIEENVVWPLARTIRRLRKSSAA